MIHNEAVRVIDFQDALMAPPQYDLASLLNDRVTDSVIRPALEERLVRYYIERRGELERRKISADEFWEIYRLSAIQTGLESRRPFLLSRSRERQTRLYEIRSADRAPARTQSRQRRADATRCWQLLREHFEAMR